MPRYAAFLRGVNLASHHRVSGDRLRSLFVELGFRDVQTFRASGNVVFEADREPAGKLAGRIEAALEEALGFEVAVFLRTAKEVKAIASGQPFDAKLVEASKGKLQVAMVAGKPAAGARKEVLALASDEDRLAFGDRELFWLPSGGTQRSALNLKAIEKLLGPTTMRTKGTVDEVAARYFTA
jgi:uncharacterized protein (DUF1697 family)